MTGIMENPSRPYQVIARKYRPQTFGSVVGQDPIVITLKNALRFNKMAHAYVFCGCRGTGKTTLARVLAKALNCSQRTEEGEPCNACPSCLEITAGKSLDVIEIDGASNRGIDDIRQINETVGYAPTSGPYKIYIIDEVHMLTKEAFNALLKTLEEPPSHVKFLFATTEPHKILPTILSRCQRFDLQRIAPEELKLKLSWIVQDLGAICEEEALLLIATLSEGSLRDAESLLDQVLCYADSPITVAKVSTTLGLMPRSSFFALDAAFCEHNLSYAFELAGHLFSSGKDLIHFVEHLIDHYRYLLKLKLKASVFFPTEQLKEQYNTSIALYTEEQCVYILDFLLQTQQQIGKTPFKRIHLEMLLLHLIRSKYRLTLPTLVKRLHELEQKETPKPTALEEKKEASRPNNPELGKETPQNCNSEQEIPSEAKPDSPSCLEIQKPSFEEALISKIQKKLQEPLPQEEEKTPSLFMSKTDWEAHVTGEAEIPTPSAAEIEGVTKKPPSCHYDTLLRFAALELEAVIK